MYLGGDILLDGGHAWHKQVRDTAEDWMKELQRQEK